MLQKPDTKSNSKEYLEEFDKGLGFEKSSKNISQKTLEWLANNLQIMIFKTKLDGTILNINEYGVKMLEYDSEKEIITKNAFNIYKNSSDRKTFTENLLETSEVIYFETELLTKNGNTLNVAMSASLSDGVISGMGINITDIKKSKEAMENSLSLLRSTLESTTDGILVIDRNGKVTDYNQNFLKMWHIPQSLAETKDDSKLLEYVLDQLTDAEAFLKKVNDLYSNPEEESFDVINFKDGRIFERFSYPQRNNKKITGRVWTFRDATERISTKTKLKENALKYRTLFETANDSIFLMNENIFVDCNSKTLEMFGCSKELIVGVTPVKFSPKYQPDGRTSEDKAVEYIERAYKGEPMCFEWKHCKLDGTLFDAEVSLNLVEFGGEKLLQAIVRDITDRKRSELLQNAVYNISQAANEVHELNHLFPEIHKIISGFINAKNFYIALYNPDQELLSFPYFVDEFDEAPAPKKPGRGLTEYVIRKGDPALINPEVFDDLVNIGEVEKILTDSVDWLGVPLKTNGKTIGALVVQTYTEQFRYTEQDKEFLTFVSDQTAMAIERTRSREELVKAKEKAEEMNQLKTRFLANMSHELRTPMVGILGYTEILKNEVTNPELKEMSEEIYVSANRLLETLNLILDLSKIEANKSEIHPVEINVKDVTINQVKCFQELAKKKDIFINIIPKEEQVYAMLDERIFRQIINNLVSNAIKFTLKGGVTIEINKELINKNENVVIRVKDTGIGIPKESHQIIFEEFRQASEGLNRIFEGSGLGLSITKRFVELMDGKISVESEHGKGSTFIVSFPSCKHGKTFEIKEPEKNNNLSNVKTKSEVTNKDLPLILLVEDDISNAGVIEYLLQDVCKVDFVKTGEEALEMTAKKQYAAIIMDIALGAGIDGIETTKRIRKMKGYHDLPIIAVTALAMKGQRESFLADGCSHYISKPFNNQTLLNLMLKLLYNGKSPD
jgi:PAS domain S-box-containing protein